MSNNQLEMDFGSMLHLCSLRLMITPDGFVVLREPDAARMGQITNIHEHVRIFTDASDLAEFLADQRAKILNKVMQDA